MSTTGGSPLGEPDTVTLTPVSGSKLNDRITVDNLWRLRRELICQAARQILNELDSVEVGRGRHKPMPGEEPPHRRCRHRESDR